MTKRLITSGLILVMAMTALFAIPASASYDQGPFDKINCGCGSYFEGNYEGGMYIDGDQGYASTDVMHDCEGTTSYASLKCWIYSSNYNNYTSNTYTDSDSGTDSSLAICRKDYSSTVYYLRATETYHKITIKCNGVTRSAQKWNSDGDVPLSVNPPVVVQ